VAFDGIPTDEVDRPGLTPDGWSAKDARYHVGAWMEDAAEQLEAMAAGRFEGRLDTRSWIDGQNRLQVARSSGMSPDAVDEYAAAARERMRGALAALDRITPDAVEWFEESGALHHRKHTEDLRAWAVRLHGRAGDRP